MPKMGGKSNKHEEAPHRNHAVKRRRSFHSGETTDSANTVSKPPSPNASWAGRVDFEIDIKEEPLDEDAGTEDGPSTARDATAGLEEDLIEAVKTENEEDPLILSGSTAPKKLAKKPVIFEDGLKDLTEELDHNSPTIRRPMFSSGRPAAEIMKSLTIPIISSSSKIHGCDEGFSPGSAENLPKINAFSVAEFILSLPDCDKEKMRKLWQQPRDIINDSIGYVQIKRDHGISIIKCVVASKTTENHCTISYNEANETVRTVYCDCHQDLCSHVVTALIWLCEPKAGMYWLQPMVARKSTSMTLSAIFGFPKKARLKNNTVLEEFVKICQENKVLNPILMAGYEEDVICTASLHNLMSMFKKTVKDSDVELFLDFCRANMKDNLDKLEVFNPETMQKLKYGRITDALLLEVSLAKDEEIGNLVEKITFPDIKRNVEVKEDLIESLEKSLNMKIKKCCLLLSNASPIFVASPYGITETHVIYIKHLEDDDFNVKKLESKYKACMQLQMHLAKKEKACFCVVHKTKRIDITIVKYNPKWLQDLLDKATEFWKTHIYRAMKT